MPTDDNSKKPWEDGEFDAEKAWTLIQNLKGDIKDLKADKSSLSSELAAAQKESEDRQTRIEELEAAAATADDTLSSKDKELTELQALRKKEALLHEAGLPLSLAENIPGDDEEAWTAQIEKFTSSLNSRGRQERTPDPAQAADPAIDERLEMANQVFGS